MSNFWKIVFHAVVMALITVIPFVLSVHPAWLDAASAGVLNAIYLYLVSKYATPATVGFASKA